MNDEISKLRTRVMLAEDSNKILVKEKKEKEAEIKRYAELYQKKASKLNEIYRVANSNKINAENYTQFVDWIKRYIMEN